MRGDTDPECSSRASGRRWDVACRTSAPACDRALASATAHAERCRPRAARDRRRGESIPHLLSIHRYVTPMRPGRGLCVHLRVDARVAEIPRPHQPVRNVSHLTCLPLWPMTVSTSCTLTYTGCRCSPAHRDRAHRSNNAIDEIVHSTCKSARPYRRPTSTNPPSSLQRPSADTQAPSRPPVHVPR
jgi:hypothetical protein